jgi:GNAT superfamily N-acetyltransferase
MRIRPAVPDDAATIARVHVASWRSTYRGLLPEDVLANLSVERREEMWRQQTETAEQDPRRGFVLVAEDDAERIVGFASAGPDREAASAFDGELYAIYLLEAHQGRGIGRALVDRVVDRFRRQGIRSMRTWVLEGNPAEAFYRRLGGRRTGTQTLTIGNADYLEVAYGWSDLGSYG